jgi:hypothetical protein
MILPDHLPRLVPLAGVGATALLAVLVSGSHGVLMGLLLVQAGAVASQPVVRSPEV